jgi:hypothetical protein
MLAIHNLTAIKLEAFTALSAVSGVASSIILFFQGEEMGGWLNTGIAIAFVTAFIPAFFLLILKLVDIYHERQKAKKKEEDEDEARHLSYDERRLEMAEQVREKGVGYLKDGLHKQIEFYKSQVFLEQIKTFEARMARHRYGDELTRIHSHVYACHSLMSQKGITIPEFALKSGDELMLGLEAEVLAFRQKLEKENEMLIHLSNG